MRMRTKVSEIVSSIDFYNREGEFDTGTWDIKTDFIPPLDMDLIEDDGVVDVVAEALNYKGDINLLKPTTTSCEHVLSFEKYIKENNYDTSRTKSYMGKLTDCTQSDDEDFDDFGEEE